MLAQLWPHIRAALITVHIIAIFVLSFPAPSGGMHRGSWRNPTVQAEFKAWSARLQALGLESTPESLEENLWTTAQWYMKRRQQVIRPFRHYYRYCGTYQSWRMFIAPHRNPSRLHIDLYEDGEWRPLYIARHPEHDWNRQLMDHERMRSALFRYAWRQYRGTYKRFGEWVARQVARERPEAQQVRLRWGRYRTQPPQKVRAGEALNIKYVHPLTFDLEKYR